MNASPVNWLLERENPSVRYFTLRDILGKSRRDFEVVNAKRAIIGSWAVKKILERQNPEGYWEDPYGPYIPKYKSTYWQIMILGQLGLDQKDSRVRRACERIFDLQLPQGGFSSNTDEGSRKEYEFQKQKGKELPSIDEFASSLVHEHQYSCLTGNLSAALIRIGYEADPRVKRALEWLMSVQNKDGGWLCPYWRAHVRDSHGCFYGTICPLEAFSELKEEHLTSEMKRSIEKGSEFLLRHRLFKADHHDFKVINSSWLKLGFPFFYGYNILRGLDVLTRLGYLKDDRLADAIDVLLEKRQKDGKWILENSPTGRMHVNIEAKGKPSKWITLIALRVLRRLRSA